MSVFAAVLVACVVLTDAWDSMGDISLCPFHSFNDATPKAAVAVPILPIPAHCRSAPNRSVHLAVPPDAGQQTFSGCKCKTSCGASVDDGTCHGVLASCPGSLYLVEHLVGFNCDWCFTEGNCGHSGHQGYFDCACPPPPTAEFEWGD
jgi:hypothetical protein